jgi:hypothetical protein
MSDSQWPLWEVFTQPNKGEPFEHAGSVHAPDGELALHNAGAVAQFDGVALAESKFALDRIPAFITDWQQAMDHGQMVNSTIRGKSRAQAEGLARFASGQKNPGQGV